MSNVTFLNCDVMEGLAQLPDASIQMVVTSPPYWGLRDYGHAGQLGLESTPDEYVIKLVEVFREVRRVLKDDGTVWLNLGDSYAGSWGAQGRSGQMADRSVVSARQIENHPQFGSRTGSRGISAGLKPKDLISFPWRVALALQADGWYLRSDIIWHKPNPMPESVRDRPTKAHEYIFLLSKASTYYYDAETIKEPVGERNPGKWPSGWVDGADPHDAISHNKGDRRTSPKDAGRTDQGLRTSKSLGGGAGWRKDGRPELRNKRSVWTIATQAMPEAHFATFPEKLVAPCILAGSKPGDTVLDPFGGSGTTGKVAARLGRKAILIEINPEYSEMAKKRCAQRTLSLG